MQTTNSSRYVLHYGIDSLLLCSDDIGNRSPGRGAPLCRVYGYVPPTRVNFSLPQIQNRSWILNFFFRNRPWFLKFYSRTRSCFDNLVSNVENASCFPEKWQVQPQFSFEKVCLSFSKRHWVCVCQFKILHMPCFSKLTTFYCCG